MKNTNYIVKQNQPPKDHKYDFLLEVCPLWIKATAYSFKRLWNTLTTCSDVLKQVNFSESL